MSKSRPRIAAERAPVVRAPRDVAADRAAAEQVTIGIDDEKEFFIG
jgi:hypothetical protein